MTKIIAVCPALEQHGPGNRAALEREVRRSMERVDGCVNSASGMTAALAINHCERLGLAYEVTATPVEGSGGHYYFVKRIPGIPPGAQGEDTA